MSNKLIVANWKMNPDTVDKAQKIAGEIKKYSKTFKNSDVVVCPPFVFLNEVSEIIKTSKKVSLGAQDVSAGSSGSHTGEIGTDLLKKSGVKYIIVGHSDLRSNLDTNEIVKEKMLESLKAGFKVVLCVGEKERNEHGDHYHEIKKEIEDAITKLPRKFSNKLIIAYEPIWAIGKSEKDAINPEQLHEITIFIKRLISDILGPKEVSKIKILYGGSVTKNNFKEIIGKGNVDGLLIGRESLKTDNFVELLQEI